MKRRLTFRYMIVFVVSVVLIIGIWLGLSYMFLFSDNLSDLNKPYYLVSIFERYVDCESLKITEEGKKLLYDNDLWAQIITDKGDVVDSFNAPIVAKNKYDIFELSEYTLKSDVVKGQTVFLSRMLKLQECGVLLGCSSEDFFKTTIKTKGSVKDLFLLSVILLLIIFCIMSILAGIFFSKQISTPIDIMINHINMFKNNELTSRVKPNDDLFKSVFDSLEKLRIKLLSAKNARKQVEVQRNEWIANISHDMRTPLATIRGYAQFMSEERFIISDNERRNYSGIIIKNSDNINLLINELKFSRQLNNGEIILNKESVNVCALLKECGKEITIVDNSSLNYVFETDEIYVEIDKDLIKRCLMNIISNAFIHNEKVNVVIKCYISDKIIIEIIDDGKGMDSDEVEKVFTRYYRGRNSDNIVGSGLGLAISKNIIELHNGDIKVESQLGKGSKFIITL